MSGVPTLPISPWQRGSVILSPLWIGQAAGCSPSDSQTLSTPPSVSMSSKRRSLSMGRPGYSTPIREVNLPLTDLPVFSRNMTYGSAWMDGAAGWIMCSLRGSGRVSNTKMFTSRHTTQLLRQERSLPTGLHGTTSGGVIKRDYSLD